MIALVSCIVCFIEWEVINYWTEGATGFNRQANLAQKASKIRMSVPVRVSYDNTDCNQTPVHIDFLQLDAGMECKPVACSRDDPSAVVGVGFVRECISPDANSTARFVASRMGAQAYIQSTRYSDSSTCSDKTAQWLHPLDTCYNVNSAAAVWKSEMYVRNVTTGSISYNAYSDSHCNSIQKVQNVIRPETIGVCNKDGATGLVLLLGRGATTGTTFPPPIEPPAPNSSKDSAPIGIIVGATLAGVAALVGAGIAIWYSKRSKSTKDIQSPPNVPAPIALSNLQPNTIVQLESAFITDHAGAQSVTTASVSDARRSNLKMDFNYVEPTATPGPDKMESATSSLFNALTDLPPPSYMETAPTLQLGASGLSQSSAPYLKMKHIEEEIENAESETRKQVLTWNAEKVSEWAVECGASEETRQKFIEHNIDGKALLLFRSDDLESVLKIKAYGELLRLQDAIRQLKR
ncbi:hypothetical protein BJ741DRAFT_327650 [Chytriomyces cf. hyalinus JEL632]|nr:hypothetical protein BJ741DRAFT_327650 [Chytriomyces cf. hyalinus JEL632]